MKKTLLLIPALALGAVAASGQILLTNVNDTFTGANIVGDDAVSQLTWVRYSTSGATLSIQENPVGNDVLQVGGSGSFKGVYAITPTPGAAITLAEGQSLSLNYDFTL